MIWWKQAREERVDETVNALLAIARAGRKLARNPLNCDDVQKDYADARDQRDWWID